MGEALFELEQVLRSKKVKLTSQEANVLIACKAHAVRDFSVGAGAGAGGGVVWLATARISKLLRINLAGGWWSGDHGTMAMIFFCRSFTICCLGIAAFSGLYRCGQALDLCVNHFLSQEGSRMQQELANIMLRKYRDDQPMMHHISKHFYPENVFDDSSVDQPKVRWRYMNFFGDVVPHSERTLDSSSYNEKTMVNNNVDAMSDLLILFLGSHLELRRPIPPASSTTLPRRHSRSLKRSRGRQGMRKQEASSRTQHALADEPI